MTGAVRADPPSLPPGEKLLFQPGLPQGWGSVSPPAGTTQQSSPDTTFSRFAPATPWRPDWEESLAVTIFLGRRMNPAGALELERKSKSEHKTSRCQVAPQMMYSDTDPANGYPAATDVVFCPDDGNGKAYLSIGKFIAGSNYYALHRTWQFPATTQIPVPTDEQRRWVTIMTGAVVCDSQAASSPCTIRPGVSYTAITPRRPAAAPSSPAADHIMEALARQPGTSAPQGESSARPPQFAPVQASSLYGIQLDQASRNSLRRAIQESGLKAIRLDLIDGIDSYKPGPEMADARQLDIHYASDGRFQEADYLFQPGVSIDRIGELLKPRFGEPLPPGSSRDLLRWVPAPALTVELRQGAGGAVLTYKRD